MAKICVIHLIRKSNDILSFKQFLSSYVFHRAGMEHELLLLFKGFKESYEIKPYTELLGSIPSQQLLLPDRGFDLGPYFIAAQEISAEYFCFLNSFCIIESDDWLLKFFQAISKPNVGIVGATGSWGSISSGPKSLNNKLPLWKKILRPFVWRVRRAFLSKYFDPFPNFHIRTNGFMVAKSVMLKINKKNIRAKFQALRLESGKNSITKQILNMGLKAMVVGKNGEYYEKDEWSLSGTFWCDNQKNLLISDNQTRKYASSSREYQKVLEAFAWGIETDKY